MASKEAARVHKVSSAAENKVKEEEEEEEEETNPSENDGILTYQTSSKEVTPIDKNNYKLTKRRSI